MHARVKLEELNSKQVRLVLFSVWAALIFAAVLSLTQDRLLLPSFTANENRCFSQFGGELCTNWQPINCTEHKNSTSTQLIGGITGLTFLNGFFAVQARLQRPITNESLQISIPFQASLRDREGSSDPWNHFAQENVTWNIKCESGDECEFSTVFAASISRASEISIILTSSENICNVGSGIKAVIVILQSEWQLVTSCFRYFSFLVCILSIAKWFYSFWCREIRWADMLIEQKWVSIMLFVLAIYQDPFDLIRRYYGGGVIYFSIVCFSVSAAFFLTFWIMILDTLRKRTHHDWGFYVPKILFGCFYFAAEFLRWFAISNANTRLSSGVVSLQQPLSVPWMVLTFIWAVWFISIFIRTSKEIRELPYSSSRYRRLSFYLFSWQSIFVIFYEVVLTVAQMFFFRDYFFMTTEEMSPVSDLLLVDTYFLLVAYVYLPASNPLRHLRMSLLGSETESEKDIVHDLSQGFVLKEDDFSRIFAHNESDKHHFLSQILSSMRALGGKFKFDENPTLCVETALTAVHLAWEAYNDPAGVKTQSGFEVQDLETYGYELVEFISDEESDTVCVIAREKNPPTFRHPRICVSFRGTSSIKNALTDMQVSRVNLPLDSNTNIWNLMIQVPFHIARTKVHSGFWRAFSAVSTRMTAALEKEISSVEGPRDLLFVGHSLGGALAILGALQSRIHFGKEQSLTVMNFGSPRVGNHSFAVLCNIALSNVFRFVFENDLVTSVPKLLFKFKHIGTEVILDSVGNIIVRPSFVEKSFRPARRSLTDHRLSKYIVSIERALKKSLFNSSERPSVGSVPSKRGTEENVLQTKIKGPDGDAQQSDLLHLVESKPLLSLPHLPFIHTRAHTSAPSDIESHTSPRETDTDTRGSLYRDLFIQKKR